MPPPDELDPRYDGLVEFAEEHGLVLAEGSRLGAWRLSGTIEGAPIRFGCIDRPMTMTSLEVEGPPTGENMSIVAWSRRPEEPTVDRESLPLEVRTGHAAFDARFVCSVGREVISGDPYAQIGFGRRGAPSPIVRDHHVRRQLCDLDEWIEAAAGASRHVQVNHYGRGLVQIHFIGLLVEDPGVLALALRCALAIARVRPIRRWEGAPITPSRLPEHLVPLAHAVQVGSALNPGFFVNRVHSGIELRLDPGCTSLPAELRKRLLDAFGQEPVQIVEDGLRPQGENLAAAVARLADLLADVVPSAR